MLFELKRKSVHLLSIIFILVYYYIQKFFSHQTAILTLVFIFISISFLEFVRLKLGKEFSFLNGLYREREKDKIPSSIYLLLGVIIAFSAFNFNIAVTALLMMMFGDLAAALFGIGLGRHWLNITPEVSWEGIIIEFLINFIIGIIILQNLIVVLMMALVATFIESVLTSIDDNLAVPVLAGFAGQVTLMMLGIFNML